MSPSTCVQRPLMRNLNDRYTAEDRRYEFLSVRLLRTVCSSRTAEADTSRVLPACQGQYKLLRIFVSVRRAPDEVGLPPVLPVASPTMTDGSMHSILNTGASTVVQCDQTLM